MATKKKQGQDAGTLAAEIGAGIAALAGAATAGYFFYASEDAKKNRKKTAKWAGEMKDKVVKEAKKEMKAAAKLDKKAMAVIVDRAAKAYDGVRNVKREDLIAAANELKNNWQEIQKELSSAAKKGTSAVKKSAGTAKKAVKKSSTAAKKTVTKVAKKAAPKKVAKKTAKKSK